MFPADAGMNRNSRTWERAKMRVPRRRGDEPLGHAVRRKAWECSPQTRG